MATHSPKCPPLGTGSYDFNAINEAAKKGKDMEEAIKAARHATPKPAPEPAADIAPAAPATDA